MTTKTMKPQQQLSAKLDKVRGIMIGQMAGDSLGGMVEFSGRDTIKQRFPNGLNEIEGGGPFRLKPGQITDDTELALGLARVLRKDGFDIDRIARAYAEWSASGPFDCGGTCGNAFGGWRSNGGISSLRAIAMKDRARRRGDSQANGGLMRISPLAIYGWDQPDLSEMVMEDATLSHCHPVCQVANAAFCHAIAEGIRGGSKDEMFAMAIGVAGNLKHLDQGVVWKRLLAIPQGIGRLDGSMIGWVLKALDGAFWSLLNFDTFRESLSWVCEQGGDSDTNGAIAGALLGAFYGLKNIPESWKNTVLNCKTSRGPTYQNTDALELADDIFYMGLMRGAPLVTTRNIRRKRRVNHVMNGGDQTLCGYKPSDIVFRGYEGDRHVGLDSIYSIDCPNCRMVQGFKGRSI